MTRKKAKMRGVFEDGIISSWRERKSLPRVFRDPWHRERHSEGRELHGSASILLSRNLLVLNGTRL